MAVGDLCQLADVQAWLPSAPTASPGVDLIAQLITAASRAICAYCGRGQFTAQSYTDTYDGAAKTWMLLRQWPVLSVTAIALTQGGVATTVSDPTAFQLEAPIPAGGAQRLTLIAPHLYFPRGRGNVQITYEAGYAAVPADVAQACIEAVGEAYQRRNRIGQTSVSSQGQTTVAFSQSDLNAAAKAMLEPYIRRLPL
jgi:uncharacterized phiE125 gp8 family phage protein